jgi:hypothetical protein
VGGKERETLHPRLSLNCADETDDDDEGDEMGNFFIKSLYSERENLNYLCVCAVISSADVNFHPSNVETTANTKRRRRRRSNNQTFLLRRY